GFRASARAPRNDFGERETRSFNERGYSDARNARRSGARENRSLKNKPAHMGGAPDQFLKSCFDAGWMEALAGVAKISNCSGAVGAGDDRNSRHFTLRFSAEFLPRLLTISYSICWFSLSAVSPARWTAEICTNTSGPPPDG